MKKRISKKNTLYYTSLYPFICSTLSHRKNIVILGIGGNIGDVKKRFHKLFLALKSNSKFTIIETSPLLQNPPFGYIEQDDFLNGIIIIKTNLSPIEILNNMQRYEKRFGRKRSFKDAPRTLDIDIIFYNKSRINKKRLIIPHRYWKDRDSVVIPLQLTKEGRTWI